MKRQKQSSHPIRPELPLDETERLLERVDENLLSRRLWQLADSQPEGGESIPTIPLPPTGADLTYPLAEMRSSDAPYYVVNGNILARIVKSLHNLIVKVFGRKQAYFNNLTMNNLEALARDLKAMHEYSKVQSIQINLLSHRIREQEKIIKELRARRTPGRKAGKRPG
jgi:hypothetical protein